MAQKKSKAVEQMEGWQKVIQESHRESVEKERMFVPSIGMLQRLEDYSRELLSTTLLMKHSSQLAHEELLSKENAQRILDVQMARMEETMEGLKVYIDTTKIQKEKRVESAEEKQDEK